MTSENTTDISGGSTIYRTPKIRHLAWMCSAPQLYRGESSFNPGTWLPEDWRCRLGFWDQNPDRTPALLQSDVAPRRLGAYFEVLYHVMIEDLLGWKVEAQNQQITVDKRTLGELDFLVRNRATGSLEHHEIAVKFYLGYPSLGDEPVLWYGPNSRDRLDLKTRRLLEHQSVMALTEEGAALLKRLGLDEPIAPKVFMPGYLFQPQNQHLPLPEQVDDGLPTGLWQHYSQFEFSDEFWVPLIKPDWLGPYLQTQKPDLAVADQWLNQSKTRNQPCLLARLVETDFGWSEAERCFLVPESWPASPEAP